MPDEAGSAQPPNSGTDDHEVARRGVSPRQSKVWSLRWRKSRKRRRTAFRIIATSGAVILMFGAAGVWLANSANQIKSDLQTADGLAGHFRSQLLSQDVAAAHETLKQLQAHTQSARRAADDPVWKLAEGLPWLGPNFSAIHEVALSADDVVSGTAQPLLNVSSALDWKSLTPVKGKFDIGPLRSASPAIVSAANTLSLTHSRLRAIDTTKLLPEVSAPLARAADRLGEIRDTLNLAAHISTVLPPMMGAGEPRNYLVLVQNSAEVRATGGLPGALAVLHADNGSIQLTQQASGSTMGKFTPPIDVAPSQTQIFTSRLGTYISDVNLTPDFPTAATSAKAMWERRERTPIDGVIALDPVVLANLLEATGPLTLPAEARSVGAPDMPFTLTSTNVVQTLLSDVYSHIETNSAQDEYFAAVARGVFGGLTSGSASSESLIKALAKSIEENRLLLWSAHSDEQKSLRDSAVGGSTSGQKAGGASFGAYFNDGTGAKMDFHIKRTAQLIRECTNDGYSRVRVRITIRNTAPLDAATALPEAVTGGGRYGVPAGIVQTNVVVYGPSQAQIETASQDGRKAPFGAQLDNDRPVGTLTTRVGPGQSRTVEFTFGKIVQHVDPVLLLTPTIQPMKDVLQTPELASCN